MARSLAGLDILECDVMDSFAACKRMIDICEHLEAGGTNVDLARVGTHGLHDRPSLFERLAAGGEARQRVREYVLPRQAQLIHRLRAYEHSPRITSAQLSSKRSWRVVPAGVVEWQGACAPTISAIPTRGGQRARDPLDCRARWRRCLHERAQRPTSRHPRKACAASGAGCGEHDEFMSIQRAFHKR